jgi:putative membrane protein
MFLPPIGLILFLFAISLLLGFSGKAFGLILGFIGIYALFKGLGRENQLIELIESMKQSLYSGKISFIMYIVAIVLIFAGSFQGIMGYTKLAPELKERIVLSMMYYIEMTIWWYIGAALAPLFGKIMSMLIERERIVRHWAILFSVIASGLLLWGGSESIIWLSKGNYTMGYLTLTFSILGAIILSFIGVKISLYIKSSITHEKGAPTGIDAEEGIVRD